MFNMIDFTRLKQEKIDAYNKYVDVPWKKAMVGKKKRAKFQKMTKPNFEELNKELKKSVKATITRATPPSCHLLKVLTDFQSSNHKE